MINGQVYMIRLSTSVFISNINMKVINKCIISLCLMANPRGLFFSKQ